jgi:hypothetical protein
MEEHQEHSKEHQQWLWEKSSSYFYSKITLKLTPNNLQGYSAIFIGSAPLQKNRPILSHSPSQTTTPDKISGRLGSEPPLASGGWPLAGCLLESVAAQLFFTILYFSS